MGIWALLLPLLVTVAQAQVCSVNESFFQVYENRSPEQPLLDIYVPEGQQVTLGPSSSRFAFRIQGTQLFLNVTPDYEENSRLQAVLECKRSDTVVTQLRVFVSVLDVNDNPPRFPFVVKVQRVPEDTKVNAVVIPETELKAQDPDKNDILFYTLQEVTPGASGFFSLVGVNRPELRLDRSLDFDRWPNMTFQLLVRDTREENVVPSHTATATLVLEVQPADLRPPWFLPCTYSDGFVCIHAQYHGAVPTGHILSGPLILHPGPIYAVDGDRGINQPIVYSIIRGNEDGSFSIGADTGNLTMTKSIPSPKTFLLLVKGEQADGASYWVTQVTVEARAASGSPPRFPQRLYCGTVPLGSGMGVAIRDAAAPSQPLRIRAQDPEFPDLNSAITYRITNNSNFRMDGEAMLTGASLVDAGVFYAEVEAKNTVTSGTATTVVEVRVSEQEPAPTGPPTSPETAGTTGASSGTTSEAPWSPEPSRGSSTTSSGGDSGPQPSSGTSLRPPEETAGTTGASSGTTSEAPRSPEPSRGSSTTTSSGTTSEAPRSPEPSRGSSTTSSGGDSGPQPPSGTTLRPPPSSTPGGPPSTVTSPSPPSASPSGGSAQTWKPGTSLPTSPGPSCTLHPTGMPGTGGSSPAVASWPGGGPAEDRCFSGVEMAALGGVLGALLLLALTALILLAHKHYGHRLKYCCGKALELQPQGFDNQAFLDNPDEANRAPAPSPSSSPVPPASPEPAPPEPKPPSPETLRRVPESPAVALDGDGPAAVRSILTKERRPEGGYKAVWFGEDIGAEADVVVLNTTDSEVDGAGDEGSEGSGDEGAEAGLRGGAQDAPGSDSIYL
ncbi:cadherin-related family member 5 [Physeter macrocephalus]|uniref:Cadherin-related family member 5 n=1 Tax=Physeter macrocephalus TaxID=9755 RepID=A0A9W2W9M2_PHYMC|nr:cadherin-related family member 5 [Physeter catodon]